jgi:hypothetical protein
MILWQIFYDGNVFGKITGKSLENFAIFPFPWKISNNFPQIKIKNFQTFVQFILEHGQT